MTGLDPQVQQKLRIIHTPVNIANQAASVSSYEKSRGHKSVVAVQVDAWTKFPFDVLLPLKGARDFRGIFRRLIYGLLSPFRFDVFHFYFGKTLLSWDDSGRIKPFRHWDIWLARLLRRRVVATFQGCDARIAKSSNARNKVTMCHRDHCSLFEKCLSVMDDRRLSAIKELGPYLDACFYVNPELGHHLPDGQFLPYSTIDVEKIPMRTQAGNAKRPLVIHAPTDPAIKGTSHILKAIEALKREFDFDFRLIQNLTHEEAMAVYQKADVAIDQVLAGWYGAFAVEMMAMGVPVACYIRQEDLHFIPDQMEKELPVLQVQLDTLENDLRKILQQKPRWAEWGRRSRQFAMRWHNPRLISDMLEEVYVGESKTLDYRRLTNAIGV